MPYLIISFIVSFILCLIFIKLNVFHDSHEGVQKFHKRPTPRIGGLALYTGLLATGAAFWISGKSFAKEYLLLLLSAFPVFLAGILEDITKKVSPKWRLLAGFISGIMAFFLVSAQVRSVDIPFVDNLLSITAISLVFSAFAFAGVSHAFNIIDGFNGLLAGISILIFSAYAYVSFLHDDYFLLYVSLSLVFVTLGFFFWNYPFGLIFLGDGGAYLLGFMAAVVGTMLTQRHPDVSPWFPLLLVLYPVWETLFSIYRRKFLKDKNPFLPDALHLHSLIYKRLIKFLIGHEVKEFKKNSYTSPFLWFMEFICFIPAVLFWNNTYLLMFFVLTFITFYTWLYFRIVKFKALKIIKKQ